MIKNVMRINRSTTDAFVRGDVGMWELERFRDVAMLEWLGRVLRMGTIDGQDGSSMWYGDLRRRAFGHGSGR